MVVERTFGRPSKVRLAELIERAEEAETEVAGRQLEALSLIAALRIIARDLESLAWREAAYQCVGQADRLRDVASRYERKWTDAA